MLERSAHVSPLAPLRYPAFRSLWIMWVLSNVCVWMWGVAAAWMMVELRVVPLWVALVQAATTFPILLFGLPCGALADLLSRRGILIVTQFWLGGAALIQGVLALTDLTTAPLLLATTFAYGCGVALRNPAYHSTVPQLVPRDCMAAALGLNAVGMNISRILGPLLAGPLIVWGGPESAFLFIGALSAISLWLVLKWRPDHEESKRKPTSFMHSLRGGLAYAIESRPFRANLLRIGVFCCAASGLPALLPLIANDIESGGASTFSVLFAAMGVGAVLSMTFMHHLRVRFTRGQLEMAGAVSHTLAMLALWGSRSQAVAVVAMIVAGWAWIVAANSMTIAAQLIVPDEVRARGMAIYQMSLMGGLALGSALWGQVATLSSVHVSVALSGICAPLGVALAMHAMRPRQSDDTGARS